MEYGEKLYTITNWTRNGIVKGLVFRYRIDPVPFVGIKSLGGKKWFYSYHKRPNTAQEKRWSDEYTRASRNKTNLVSAWDDIHRGDIRSRKSWKKRHKVKKQWMKGLK